MTEDTSKLTLQAIANMAESVQTYVSGQLQNVNFSGLQDTPTGYLGHSGDYLVVKDNESGIHFTGIEKIAQDLTDYGFSAGATTFTGLSDTPSDFTAGKYLRVNDAGDALEYVDRSELGSGATQYIDSVVTKTENGPIDKRSIDTTASSTNYYRVPIESLRFDDLEVGATYRLSVRLKGYASSDDLGAGLTIYNRASSFSSDINLDSAGIQNFNNAGGDNDPAVISLNVADNLGTTYGASYFDSNIFTATGTHLDVLASSVSQKSFIDGIRIELEKLTVGGGGGNYEFCKAFAAAGQTLSHHENDVTNVNLDTNNLTQESQNWLHTDTTLNVVGIKIQEDGLYNINSNLQPSRDPWTNWQQDVLNLRGVLRVLRVNGTNEVLAHSQEAKTTSEVMSNAALLTVTFSLDNVYLQQDDFVFMDASVWMKANETTQNGIDENLTYISVSKAGFSAGATGEVNSNTQDLTEQISQTIVNDDLIIVDTDYSFQTKYLNGSINSNGGIADLEFNDLTVGDTYRLSSTVSINSDGTASDKIKVNYYHDGNKIAAVYSNNISQTVNTSILFNATSNSLLVSGQNLDANNYIEGSPNEITFTQIEKISNNLIAPEIISVTDGSTQTFDGSTMADSNYIKIEGDNVSATIEIDADSFVVSQSGEQMIWDQGGVGETTLNLGESINVTLSNGRVIEIKFYRSGSLYFAINKKSEPTIPPCVSSPVTITVESEYDSATSTSTFKYITSDSNGNGGLFGCIDVNRGETLTIFVTGDEPNLISHPLKITNYNDLGQAMAPLSGVVKTDLTEGPYEDHTYSLTWVVPCDTTIDKYQYQCENHAGMRGTINVFGACPPPTPTPSTTPTPTPTPTPSITPTPSVSAGSTGDYFDTFNLNEEMFLPITLE